MSLLKKVLGQSRGFIPPFIYLFLLSDNEALLSVAKKTVELTCGWFRFIEDDIRVDLGGGSPSGIVPAVLPIPSSLPTPSYPNL